VVRGVETGESGEKRIEEMSDRELIREAKSLHAHIERGLGITTDDLYKLEKLIGELERRGYVVEEGLIVRRRRRKSAKA
jgi:hypothetical protein